MILLVSTISEILVESAIGILVVFIALTLLVFSFITSGKLSQRTLKKRVIKSGKTEETIATLDINEMTAISLALHLYLEQEIHDQESNIITIKRIQRRYSPWSSKIYSMNNFQ